MELSVKNFNNKKIFVSDLIFNKKKINEKLIHQIYIIINNKKRQWSSSQKNRSLVKGSNKKPWRQKGTGKARSGSVKSPIWRSGGITFAKKSIKCKFKINKKMYKESLKNILTYLIKNNKITIYKSIIIKNFKTKLFIKKLINYYKININKDKNIIIIVNTNNNNIFLASRNISYIDVINVHNINLFNLLKYDKIIFTIESIKKIEDKLK